jgi:putative phosphonate metabolism protein
VTRLYSKPMSNYPRYAIYYAPAHTSDLDRFGAQLLGYDAFGGHDLPFPEGVTEAAPDWHDLTADPRKYGFHATLKAPFSLAPDRTETQLFAACGAFAATPRTIPVIKPVVGSISGFIAVIPAEPPQELIHLAADCVTAFDVFRAPLTDADRARRNPSKLTLTQRDHLDHWGYPYVMDDFRFHMTLTGRLGSERRESVLAMLRARFAELGLATLAIDRIVVFRQESTTSRFRIVGEWELRAADTDGVSPETK